MTLEPDTTAPWGYAETIVRRSGYPYLYVRVDLGERDTTLSAVDRVAHEARRQLGTAADQARRTTAA